MRINKTKQVRDEFGHRNDDHEGQSGRCDRVDRREQRWLLYMEAIARCCLCSKQWTLRMTISERNSEQPLASVWW
jgi:hypothetical protein